MSKGYMIFVEGMNAPTYVHEDHAEAVRQMHALALRFRGKEVLMLQINKRVVHPEKVRPNEAPVKLQTHIPPKDAENPKRRLGLKDLVYREQTA